jgi:hypothetical protein
MRWTDPPVTRAGVDDRAAVGGRYPRPLGSFKG